MSMQKVTLGSFVFQFFNYGVLCGVALLCLLPYLHIIAGSFATNADHIENSFLLFPKHFTLEAYKLIFATDVIPKSILVTVFITVAGTFINLSFTSVTAYALARKGLRGRNFMMFLVVFTMLFDGGMIPSYLLVKSLNMIDTYWAVMIPNAITAFNLILMRNFFMALPEELFESAKIDGCNEFRIFTLIVLPLSKAALATFTLFYAVMHWNSFMLPFLYLNDPNMWPIQIWLRQVIVLANQTFSDYIPIDVEIPTRGVQMATIVVATLPILVFYPFIQKYFTKGVLLGSVKG